MQNLTSTEPVHKSVWRMAVILYHKFITLINKLFRRNYNTERAINLKTEYGCIYLVLTFARPLGLYPWEFSFAFTHMPFVLYTSWAYYQFSKRDMISEQLKSIVLETTEIRFPESEWLHFHGYHHVKYRLWCRSGIFCKLFNFCLPLCSFAIANGKIEAIANAVKQGYFNRAIVLSYSESASSLCIKISLRVSENFNLQTTFEGPWS